MGQQLQEERTKQSEKVQRPPTEVLCSRNIAGASTAGLVSTRESTERSGSKGALGVVRPPIARAQPFTSSEMGVMTKG